jgi:hypothetical protein
MIRLACDLCPRRGQYRKDTLITLGGNVLMPDVRHLIARCPRKDAPGVAFGVYYADLLNGATDERAHARARDLVFARPAAQEIVEPGTKAVALREQFPSVRHSQPPGFISGIGRSIRLLTTEKSVLQTFSLLGR